MSDENYSYLNYKTNNNNNDAPTDFKSQIQARSLNRGGNKKSQNKRIVDGTHNGQRNPSQYNSNIILDSEATEGSSFHETAYFNERAKNPKLEVY